MKLISTVSIVGLALGGALFVGTTSAQDAICARVQIQISQRVLVTRTAFEASLTIDNDTDDILEDVLVEIDIQDLGGGASNDLFAGLDLPTLTGFTGGGVDGTGDVPTQTSANARWLLVPEEGAAPGSSSVKYTVGGRVRHKHGGVLVDIPLYPVEIEVFPDAALYLDYYLQRVVYSDNPFTPRRERAEPFSLGLIVRNAGQGAARNLRITSSQPEITNNERDLLVAFEILGAELGNQPLNPSLSVDFGDLAPGTNQVARWLMTSSLQGRFECMDVEFEHVTNLGNASISLLEDADIYRQVHTVLLASPFLPPALLGLDDGLPDFLVDDDPSQPPPDTGDEPVCGGSLADDIPDLAHSSEGSIQSVRHDGTAEVTDAPTIHDLVGLVRVTVSQAGWNYVRFANPSELFELALASRLGATKVRRKGTPLPKVTQAVGGPGDIGNVWTTERWEPFDRPEDPQHLERLVHVFDYFEAPGTYLFELVYRRPGTRLRASDRIVSLGDGGTIVFELEAGLENAGKPYLLTDSTHAPLSGPAGTARAPSSRNVNAGVLAGRACKLLENARGLLDTEGRARARLTIPPGCRAFPPGTKLHHAFLVEDAAGMPGFSNQLETLLIP